MPPLSYCLFALGSPSCYLVQPLGESHHRCHIWGITHTDMLKEQVEVGAKVVAKAVGPDLMEIGEGFR